MTPDFSFITHTAKRHANEVTTGSLRHRLAERGLANTRRANEAENRAFDFLDAILNRKIFKNPFFHLIQTVMVRIQNARGFLQVFLDP